MAETKYALLLEPRRNSNLRIRHQPWYEERLNIKYKKKPSLVGSTWTFVKDGLDDFRDGFPPIIDSSVIIKGNKGLSPSIHGSNSFANLPIPRQQKLLNKDDIAFSKTLPRQKLCRNRVDDVERELLDHPLALYTHLEESVPPDLFEDIVDLLDPSLTLHNQEDMFDEEDEISFTPPLIDTDNVAKDEGVVITTDALVTDEEICPGYKKAIINSRRRNARKLDEETKEDKNKVSRKKLPSQRTKIECVTKDFCDWVKDLGGETNNIEEYTVNNLFASGYETKPTLSVPVHVVELTNVPPELRADDVTTTNDDLLFKIDQRTKYKPSWVKTKYGAWYLDPKTWKTRLANEPLTDPKDRDGSKLPEAKEKSKELDQVLSTLHGTQALKSFIEKKGSRTLKFLDNLNLEADNDLETNVK